MFNPKLYKEKRAMATDRYADNKSATEEVACRRCDAIFLTNVAQTQCPMCRALPPEGLPDAPFKISNDTHVYKSGDMLTLKYANDVPQVTPYDPVTKPEHYNSHPSGVECITITEHFSFCLGNAMKYLWRSEHSKNQIQDLKKAMWYIQREIDRLDSGT